MEFIRAHTLGGEMLWTVCYVGGSCTHTLEEENPYWMVDLERDYPISKVLVLNRGKSASGGNEEGTGSRLRNMIVKITSEKGKKKQFGFFEVPGKDAQIIELKKDVPVKGRYVKIQLMATEYLQLCEVEVIGRQC